MEIVAALRILASHRRAVIAGALLAFLIGAFLLYSAREHTTGYATSRVLISGPHAPATDLDSEVAGTLAPRASLVADLMATEPARLATAAAAGIKPSQVAIAGPVSGAAPAVPVPLAVRATEAARSFKEPYVLNIVADTTAPIATLTATGPDANVAAKLVVAAMAELETVVRRDPQRSQIEVERTGAVVAGPVVARSSRAAAVLVAGIVFILWCSAIVVVARIVRHRRRTGSPALRPVSP